ncbi:MAG: TonB-dependent receptor [Rhodothermaceae bacterium]|nr:TonB-dependent receptor [Rhodothermaceae bacterium]
MPTQAFGQERASISGYVTESTTGETILGANVYLKDTSSGSVTNNSGYYIISGIRQGSYTVVWSFIGYEEVQRAITFEPGQSLRVDVELTPSNLSLQELVVEADALGDDRQSIGSAQVTTKLVKQVPAVLQADVFRSIQLLPGIKAASDFSSGLYIRGGSPDQTLILLDRTTVYNPTHFFGFFSTFNPDAIKDIRLYKGAYPAEYGGRLGSVVDIYNKDGNRNNMAGTLSIGLLSSRASIEGPYSKGSYMLAFRRSTLEPVLAVLRNQVDNVPDAFYFYDINGKINFDADANNRVSVAFYSGVDDVKFPIGEDLRFNLNYGNRTLSTTWTRILSPTVFANLTLTGSNYFSTPLFEFGGTDFERSNTVNDLSVKSDFEWMPNSVHSVRSGIWAGHLTLNLKDRFDGLETLNSRIETSYAVPAGPLLQA